MEPDSFPHFTQSKIYYYFNLAKQASLNSNDKKFKIGSILVYKNKIIGIGWNTTKTAPIQAYWNKLRFNVNESGCNHSLHAETAALLKAKKHKNIDWNKVYVFNWRTRYNGEQGLSKPCRSCEGMLKNQGIKNIFYSTNNKNGWCYERI